ncbi:MAG: DUF6288 domain-containing protein [Lentisphaeria bacterium]|nr:DUF6288 domain-containing protein [Lentisphaeria bacterium]
MASFNYLLITLILLPGLIPFTGRADDGPSLTDMGPYETPSRHASGSTTYNLGPTGARGWTRAYDGGKLFWGENGKEILVTWVDPGSPADGILRTFDVIIGTNGETFDKDARVCLGEAVFAAEKADGKLRLTRWRDGETSEVVIELPPLGEDAAMVPLKPEHSEAIRERALAYLATYMHPDGFKMHPSYKDFNALFMLAHGRPEDLDYVRRNIQHIVNRDPEGRYGPWAWVTGMDAILLAEYVQATGDTHVLPALDNLCRWMENARSYAGGWGHGGPYGGYGHVGLPGMFNAIGLVLARECGVTGYDRVIKDALNFYARGAGLGMIGYGGFDASMNLKTIYGDNGKNGVAAVLYEVLGDEPTTRAFATTASALAPYNESGHTGHFWSYSWGSLGAAAAPRPYQEFHAETTAWYYTMARTWRGGLNAQPWMGHMGSYAPNGAIANTGGLALWYCRPMRSLRILGGERGVFVRDLSGALAKARQTFYDRDYNGCLEILNGLEVSGDQKHWADQLAQKVRQTKETIAWTKAAITADLAKGDVYTAERRLNALKPILSDPNEMADLEKQLETPENKVLWTAGETYFNAMQWENCKDFERFHRAPGIVFNNKKRQEMKTLAEGDGYYAGLAAAALTQWPEEPEDKDVDLFKKDVVFVSDSMLYVGKDAGADKGVNYTYYEFDGIPPTPEAVREMTPVKEGVTAGFELTPRKRRHNFAFVFRTFLDVSEDREARFTTTSDDGSYLYVDGKLVVDNGGTHGMIAKHGDIQLDKGPREIECVYIQGAGAFGLKVDMAEAGTDGPRKKVDEAFTVDDPAGLTGLRLKIKATDPITVYLNGEVITRIVKKRKKGMLDSSWKEWETVTLKPVALTLLKEGENVLSVESAVNPLDSGEKTIGVQLQGLIPRT